MKKWIALTLSVIMALSLCACTGNSGNGDDNEEDKKVKASLLTEVTMTSISDDETVTMKAVLEYDKDYNLVSAKTYEDDELRVETTYANDMNKPLSQKNYDEDGDLASRWEYTYDDDGNELTCSYYNADNEVEWGYVRTYDENGNILTEKNYTEDELQVEYRYTYNADGKMVEQIAVWEYGDESWVRCTYDDHGNILAEKSGSGDEEYHSTTYENTYDGDKLMEVKVYEADELSEHTKYDADGNEILSVSYFEDEETNRTEATYENGKLIRSVSFTYGEESYCVENTYNDDGKLTERRIKYTDDNASRMVFTYNDNGDITGMQSYNGDKLEGEYSLTYEQVTVSKEVAKKIEAVRSMLDL